MEKFRLYRIQLFQRQTHLFERDWRPAAVLYSAFAEDLFLQLRTRVYFTEGKVINKSYVNFKFVRTGRLNGTDFIDGVAVSVEYPDKPYVDVVVNCETGVCAISRNSKFLASQDVVAATLSRILQKTSSVSTVGADVHVDKIKDPRSLVDHIRRSSAIYKLYFDVRRENAFDADDFVPGIKNLTRRSGAGRARTLLSDGAINAEAAEKLVRSSASTGDDAGAWLRFRHSKRAQKFTLGSSAVEFDADRPDGDLEEFSGAMDAAYARTRHGSK